MKSQDDALKQALPLIDKWASKNIMFICIKGTYLPKVFAPLKAKFEKYVAGGDRVGGFLDFLESECETKLLQYAQEVPMLRAEETCSQWNKKDGPIILDLNGNAFLEEDFGPGGRLKKNREIPPTAMVEYTQAALDIEGRIHYVKGRVDEVTSKMCDHASIAAGQRYCRTNDVGVVKLLGLDIEQFLRESAGKLNGERSQLHKNTLCAPLVGKCKDNKDHFRQKS